MRKLLAVVACCFTALPVAAGVAELRGLGLEEAIRLLGERGLNVLYSSDLVTPDMVVEREPETAAPAAMLAALVEPFGLAVAPGPNGSVLLVRAGSVAAGRVIGRVRRSSDGAPVAGVGVHIGPGEERAVTGPDGRFAFTSLLPGRYPVALDAGRFVLDTPYVARVRAGRTTNLGLEVSDARDAIVDEIVVSASRYELGTGTAPSLRSLTATDLQTLPTLGEDALRSANRLPGTAGADISAKGNIRGGEADETLVRFDGLRLYNPYHLKDFQSVFSAIDPGLVRRMDVSTGGYPARYGARMSGVIDIEALHPAEMPYREISLSFFNVAALAAGGLGAGDGEWLLSARRSNLDLWFDLLEPDLGSPGYAELYGRVAGRIDDRWSVSGNVLAFDDDIDLADEDQEEIAAASYRDAYAWLRLDYARDGVAGSVIAAHTDLESTRHGTTDQPGVAAGALYDRRGATVDSVQVDWAWEFAQRNLFQTGLDWRHSSGHYEYRDEAQFALLFQTPGAPTETERSRALDVSPDGQEYGAYASLRVGLLPRLTAEAGLRWERETLTADHENRFSPRIGVLLEPRTGTKLRASWGRFLQLQAINELQISDGVTEFQPAQRAEHWIAGLEHDFASGTNLRVEAYRKNYDRLRPRYENLLHTLVLLPELKPDRIRIAPEAATASGVEVSLRTDPARPWSGWAHYSRARVEDEVDGVDVPRAWDQRHAVGAGMLWRGDRWEWSLAAGYRSGWPTTAVSLATLEPQPIAAAGPRNGERLDDYFALDARIARQVRFGDGDSLTVFLEVTNLTSRVNQCCVEYEINDDIGELQLEVQSVDYLRILPSLGFVWRF